MKYVCGVCGYEYSESDGDPGSDINPGTAWENLPDSFSCPVCGVGKDEFSKEE
jgi:rubredoxin-NAD+ reductase